MGGRAALTPAARPILFVGRLRIALSYAVVVRLPLPELIEQHVDVPHTFEA